MNQYDSFMIFLKSAFSEIKQKIAIAAAMSKALCLFSFIPIVINK
ncbi:MAG: hypothetical protein BWY51_00995 [Parcubacteria group bacterium ADurb.Bin316]|nr:MAG: hypothetical protein BWY51_00995 [Parcubacteria group bacterium ADurb.Bin316]